MRHLNLASIVHRAVRANRVINDSFEYVRSVADTIGYDEQFADIYDSMSALMNEHADLFEAARDGDYHALLSLEHLSRQVSAIVTNVSY